MDESLTFSDCLAPLRHSQVEKAHLHPLAPAPAFEVVAAVSAVAVAAPRGEGEHRLGPLGPVAAAKHLLFFQVDGEGGVAWRGGEMKKKRRQT